MSSTTRAKKREGLKFPSRQEFLDSCHPQPSLSFRKPLIEYMLKFPKSAKLYQKLIQCCKLFFLKNPILVIPDLYFGDSSDKVWKYCSKVSCPFSCSHTEFDLTKLCSCKIWIIRRLTIIDFGGNNDGIKELLPKLYKCDAKDFYFVDVEIGLADLKLMSKALEGCYLKYVCVTNKKGREIPLEDLLEVFSSCVKVTVHEVYNDFVKSYKKLVNVCSKIEINELYHLDDDFDVDTFVALLEKTNCPSVIYYERKIDDRISTWRPLKDDEEEYYESTDEEEEDSELSEGDYESTEEDSEFNDDDDEGDFDSDDTGSNGEAPVKTDQNFDSD